MTARAQPQLEAYAEARVTAARYVSHVSVSIGEGPIDAALLDVVVGRLCGPHAPTSDVADLVFAACEGTAALTAQLGSAASARPTAPPATDPATATVEPPGAFLTGITVEGFRGIGPSTTLGLQPGPGLTLVVGRNGSGKSSFAEAAELVIARATARLSRAAEWRDGWRNLEHAHARIEVRAAIAGHAKETAIVREWADGKDLASGTTHVQHHGEPRTTLDSLAWGDALAVHRPFLSYSELGTLLEDAPSKLYDALRTGLGVDELGVVEKRLADERKQVEGLAKREKDLRKEVIAALAPSTDERAVAAHTALKARAPDREKVRQVLERIASDEDASRMRMLEDLSRLQAPSVDTLLSAVDALQTARGKVTALGGTDAVRAQSLAALLRKALDHHRSHAGSDCPVCGRTGALDGDWERETAARVTELVAEAAELSRSVAEREQARRAMDALLTDPPAVLSRAGATAAAAAWTEFASARTTSDDEAACALVLGVADRLAALVDTARADATRELERMDAAWRPLADQLMKWCAAWDEVESVAGAATPLKAAETWVKQATTDLLNERLAPISEQVRHFWSLLRLNSSVELDQIGLAGSATRRRAELRVKVESKSSVALSVMSQGELNALALSLFLPRTLQPDSPFRFVLIDDPVQAMDPARVEGLARALDEVAKQRQVVVFTHDDRLPAAVRRLAIAATVVRVVRKPGSVVDLEHVLDPARQALADAWRVLRADDLPERAKERVLPGLCRAAVEAACTERVYRRRLSAGHTHDEIEELLSGARTLLERIALARWDDVGRAKDVLPTFDASSMTRWMANILGPLNKGTHGEATIGLTNYVANSKNLVEEIERW